MARCSSGIIITLRFVSDLETFVPDFWATEKGFTVQQVTSPKLLSSLVVISEEEYFIVKLRTIFSSRLLMYSFNVITDVFYTVLIF